ncbi:nucleic acid-binding protein [Gigaspora margarita]|uniref:Nucleic acid-binding protein n=1 Tax=Gigaspora margarita TaxID=4874 RepID=A0A8H4A5B1_GIGMA|nr:nucleic acid-binding protein [Gigaspora margarita]
MSTSSTTSTNTPRYGAPPVIPKPIPITKNGVIKIKELRPWIRGFDLKCIILERLGSRVLKSIAEVEIHNFLVADDTAVCTLVIWENGQHYNSGDIVQITHGETRIHEGTFELTVNKNFGKIKVVDWDVMPYVEEEQPNLSNLLWVQEEDNQFVPMTHSRVPLDLITFKPIEQNSQQLQRNTNEPLIQTTNQLMNIEIKQEDDTKIKLEEEDINGAKQELHMRPQMWRQSSESRQHLSSQQSDRPRGAKRKQSYQRRDSWWDSRDRDQDRDGMRGDSRNERGDRGRNPDNRRGRQQLRNRGRDWDRGRDRDHRERDREWEYNRPHTDLDRPEEGELVDIDFASFAAGMNRGDNNHSTRKQPRLD